jgi:amino acid adenylation domain-containing protein
MDFVLIGKGSLAVECARMAVEAGLSPVAVVTDTADLVKWAVKVKAVALDPDRISAGRLELMEFDFLFSVNNPLILSATLLSRARRCCVNYHDSPLPGYAGLNATSWALLHGEPRHGISWHLMEKSIDSGDVLVERTFELSEFESAFSLNLRCFREALIGFSELLSLLRFDNLKGRRQERGIGSYFGEKDVPFGAGVIDFSEPAFKIERLSRALEFGPTFNPLCALKVAFNDLNWFAVGSARAIAGGPELGEGVVGSIKADSWIVGSATQPVQLLGFKGPDGADIAADVAARRAGITEGWELPSDCCDLGLLTQKTGELKRYEGFWHQRLRSAPRLDFPRGLKVDSLVGADVSSSHEFEFSSSDISGASEAAVIVAFAIVMADLLDVEKFDLDFEDSRVSFHGNGLDAFFTRHVPLRVDLSHHLMNEKNWEEHFQAEIDLCRRRVGYSRDLFVRDPSLHAPAGDGCFGVAIHDAETAHCGVPPTQHLVELVGNRQDDEEVAWRLLISRDLSHDQLCRLGERVSAVLRQLNSGKTPATAIPFSVDEQKSILAIGTGAVREYPLEQSLGTLLSSAFKSRPGSVAVIDGSKTVSYGELDALSSQLATGLIFAGYGNDRFIGITAERSIEQIVGLLAIAKVGSGFVAIDPRLPSARQRLMAKSTGIRLLLARDKLDLFDLPETRVGSIDEMTVAGSPSMDREPRLELPRNPAYVTFTSGSTGEPKGVCVGQRSLVNFLFGAIEAVGIVPSDRRLQFSNLSFDVALEEIFCTFLSGATLVLRDDDCLGSALRFTDFIEGGGITVLDLPTAFFEIWVGGLAENSRPLPAELRCVVVGGQALFQKVVESWYRLDGCGRISLLNCYGPAEATVAVTYVKLDRDMKGVPIGKPLPNTLAIPMGRRGHPRPVGLVGEILLGGECLAGGYLGQDELTRERFQNLDIWQSDGQGSRFYRTGDYGWYGVDGNLRYQGREDRQVKVRGFRIEIEEVEAELCRIDGVISAAVFENEGRLYGAVASNSRTGEQIRSEMASRVPDYMVPARLIVCDRLEMTPSGKVDWEWLKAEVAKERSVSGGSGLGSAQPDRFNPLHRSVLNAFADALDRGGVGLDDDFFDYGGDSLGVVRILDALEGLTDIRVPLTTFLDNPTPRGLIDSIETRRQGGGILHGRNRTPEGRWAARDSIGDDVVPVFVVTPLGRTASSIARCMSWHPQPLYNLDIGVFDASGEPVSHQTVSDIASRLVKELRSLKVGCSRCSLVGFSFGGLVACEMARELEAGGNAVEALVLIDPSYPRLDFDVFRADPRLQAFEAGAFERRLRPPSSLTALPGRARHAVSVLRELFAIRTRTLWTRLVWERALAGGNWHRRLSAEEELALCLREVRKIERRSKLRTFDLAAPVFIFLASDSYRDDVELRWRLLVGDDAVLEMLEGDHLGILKEERKDLSDRLQGVFAHLNRELAEN